MINFRSLSSSIASLLPIVCYFLVEMPASRAADGTWINATTNSTWGNTANWTGGIIADGTGAIAKFDTIDIAGGRTVTLDTSRTVGTLRFDDTGSASDASWTLAASGGSILTLNNGGAGTTVLINANQVISFGNSVIIAAQMSGPSNVLYNHDQANSGSTRIFEVTNSANNYTGSTTVQNGFLNVGSANIPNGGASRLGDSTSAVILGTAATLAVPAGGSGPNVGINVAGNVANNYTFARNIDSTATANVAGRNNVRFTGNNVNITGTLTVSGNWALGATALRSYGLTSEGPNATLDYTGAISGGSTSAFRLNDFGSGVGTIRISNASNTYTSETRVVSGRLLINGDAAAATGVLGANGTLRIGENGTTGIINTAGVPNIFPTALTAGAFMVAKAIALDQGGTNGVVPSAFAYVVGGNTVSASLFSGNVSTTNQTIGRTLNVTQVAGGTTTFSGIINDNASATQTTRLEKIGAGTVALSGNNTFEGGTRVLAGTLLANNTPVAGVGSATGIGTVNVGLVSPLSSGNSGTVNPGTSALVTRQINGISNAVAATLQPGQTVTGTNIPAGAVIDTVSIGTGATTSSIVISLNLASIPANTPLNFTDLEFGALTTTGTLQLGDGGANGVIAPASALTVNTGSTFVVNRSDSASQGTNFSTAPITGGGSFVQAGSGSTTLNAANSYEGLTTIDAGRLTLDNNNSTTPRLTSDTGAIVVNTGGTLLLSQSRAIASTDRIADGKALFLAGGTFDLGDKSEGAAGTTGLGLLTLSASSTLDFGLSSIQGNVVQFAGVFAHTTGTILTIADWNGIPFTGEGSERLLFSGNLGEPSSFDTLFAQSEVVFTGYGPGYSTTQFSGFYEVSAVPEPSTIFGAVGLLGLVGWRERRRVGIVLGRW